ncbi:MAG: fibronectin type III domain-containing protein [Bacteroidales bacterium]|nr:fibronectin type III domain-containing protein [Bacteroidales bacterium]
MKKNIYLMKENTNLSHSKNCFGISWIISLFLLLFLTINVSAQNTISREAADYPDGEVPAAGVCADPTNLSDDACIIILPPAQPGVDYSFPIPLQNEADRPDIDFDFTQVGSCSEGSISFNPDGTIEMSGISICIPDDGNNYIIIELETYNNSNDDEDAQKYYLPILRTPVKVVLVLDRSGSMNWTIPGGTAIRWDVLKKSVWEFVTQLELHQQIEDSIGLTYFATTVIQPGIPIEDGFELITPDDAPKLVSDTINYLMNLQTPGGWTAMGSGLKDAKSKLEGNTPIGATKIVLLFTDGQQNQFPEVLPDGITLEDASLLNDGPCAVKDSINYYTIGMGSSAAVPPVLSAIASANSGMFLYTTTGDHTDFETFFDNHFTDMLNGGSPQIIARKVGKLVNDTASHTFTLNGCISQAIFKISHHDGDNLNFTIEKNGIDYTPEKIIESSFLKMTKIKFPIINEDVTYAAGEWTVTVTGDSDEEYYVTCIADDHFLDYSCKADKDNYITGEYIDFTVNLSYAGNALTGANDTVKVIIFKPGDDLGHLLATYSLPDDAIDYTNSEFSPEEQKFLSLMNDPDFYNKLLPEEQIINLVHQGNGIYTGTFNSTNISGVYQALFRLKGEIPVKGQFEREKQISIVFENGEFVDGEANTINDNIPPSIPANLNSSNITHTSVDLNWNASNDNIFVTYYKIYRDGELLDSTTTTSFSVIDLENSTDYSFYIIAKDIGHNYSGPSDEITITTLDAPDTEAPTSPSNLIATNITQTNLYLNWNASSDNINVTGYTIYQNNDSIACTEDTSYSVINLTPGTNYSYFITAQDEEKNKSEQSNVLSISTLDVPQVLTAPTKLTALDITQTTLNLNWNASTGNVGYLEYEIYQDGSLIGTTSNVIYSVIDLKVSTSYSFHVIARDSEGNVSVASNIADAITLDEVEDIENGYTILTIRPINKFGYYLGPGFKRKIKLKYIAKVPKKPVVQKSSILNVSQEQKPAAQKSSILNNDSQEQKPVPEPYLKCIKDNLDGSYYLIVANVLPKTNPNILITIGDEVYYEGPINGKLPIWFYILIILILLLIIILWIIKSKNKKILMILLWILLILLLIILYLHRTGVLNFL